MKLVIGLGNIGEKYLNTRHNTGFLVVDRLKKHKSTNVKIFKSTNFMNESGSFVLSLYTKYDIQNTDLYIIHDDLDLPLGTWKIQYAKGPKEHNGILDIEEKLGTKDFWRVRVGIDPTSRKASRGEEIVLSDFTKKERVILDKVINKVVSKLDNI
ncbi:MAG: aminoacyl-tRNA hydrolase [Patescibacteria group bacterium]